MKTIAQNLHHISCCFVQFKCDKNYRITAGHSNVTSKYVSWYRFSWATLYII